MFNYKFKDLFLDYNIAIAWGQDNCLYGAGIDYSGVFSSNLDGSPTVKKLTQIKIPDMKQIFPGVYHTYILKEDRTALGFGSNSYGELGAKRENTLRFGNPLGVSNIKRIASGDNHAIIETEDGVLYGSGNNNSGQLGLGSSITKSEFTQIPFDGTNIKKIACGNFHTMILKNDGTLYATGVNTSCQLGLNHTNNVTTFTKIEDVSDVKDVVCGFHFSLILKNDGTVWATGSSAQYQFSSSKTMRTVFTLIETGVKQIACGSHNTFIIKDDDTLWASGYNTNGKAGLTNVSAVAKGYTQLTNGTNVKQIICGQAHAFVIKNDNTIYSFGYNLDGRCLSSTCEKARLGLQQVTEVEVNDIKEIKCGGYHTIVIKNDNTYWGCGNNDTYRIAIEKANKYQSFTKINIDDIKNVKYDTDDDGHLAVLKNDGTLWACGNNGSGNIGVGHGNMVTVLTQIADNVKDFWISEVNTYILKNDDSLWSCGANWCGEAGLPKNSGPNHDDDNLPPTKIMDNANIKTLLVSESWWENTRLLKNDGTLWCTGWNDFNFGIETEEEDNYGFIKTQENVKEIFPSAGYTFIVKDDNTLWVCGDASRDNPDANSLGLGDIKCTGIFTKVEGMDNVKTLKSGYWCTVAVKNDGTVWTCGDNTNGELGLGDFNDRKVFTKVNLNNVIDVHLIINDIDNYIIYVCEDGLYFSGNNTSFLKNSERNSKHPTPVLIDIDEKIDTKNIKHVKVHFDKMVIIMENGDAFYCGTNYNCDSGLAINFSYNTMIINGLTKYEYMKSSDESYPIDVNGEIIKIVSTITNNKNFTYVKDSDNNIYVKGANDVGQLGLGDNNNRDLFVPAILPTTDIKTISCGSQHTLLLDNQNRLYCTGSNNHGQLNNLNDTNTFIELNTNVINAKAARNLTIIEKDGQVYVAGESFDDGFNLYEF